MTFPFKRNRNLYAGYYLWRNIARFKEDARVSFAGKGKGGREKERTMVYALRGCINYISFRYSAEIVSSY